MVNPAPSVANPRAQCGLGEGEANPSPSCRNVEVGAGGLTEADIRGEFKGPWVSVSLLLWALQEFLA